MGLYWPDVYIKHYIKLIPKKRMKRFLIIALLLMIGGASAITCPFCSGKVVEVCNVDIQPEKPVYRQDLVLNITKGFLRHFEPIEEGTEVEIWFYNTTTNVKKVKLETDERGIIRFTPEIVGYHLIKVCGKSILVFVNTTCGDGICYGYEARGNCPEDCGFCGDYICDANEDINCPDCAKCGDGICSGGENKETCIIDCYVCGDKVCDEPEDYGSCRLDCPSGGEDGLCDMQADGICDPDCRFEEDIDCRVVNEEVDYPGSIEREENGFDFMFYIPVAIIAVCAVVMVFLFMKYGRTDERLEGWGLEKAGAGAGTKTKAAEEQKALEEEKELARIAEEQKRKALEEERRVLEAQKKALEEEKKRLEEEKRAAEQKIKEELRHTAERKRRYRELQREEARRRAEEERKKKEEEMRRREAERWRELISRKYAREEVGQKKEPKPPKTKIQKKQKEAPKESPQGEEEVHKSVKEFLNELKERVGR